MKNCGQTVHDEVANKQTMEELKELLKVGLPQRLLTGGPAPVAGQRRASRRAFSVPAWQGQAFPEASQDRIWRRGGEPAPPLRLGSLPGGQELSLEGPRMLRMERAHHLPKAGTGGEAWGLRRAGGGF